MSDLIQSKSIVCPWCHQEIELLVDASAGPQHYVEDCEVCCRPTQIKVSVDRDGYAWVEVEREDG